MDTKVSEEKTLVSDDKYKCVNDDELPPDYDLIMQGLDNSSTPKHPKEGIGCLQGCKSSPHMKAWILTILILLFILFLIIWPILATMWIIFIFLFYLGYCFESFYFSSSYKYLRNIHIKETVYEYITRLQTYKPSIWWRVQCYHYETRSRTVTDSNGNTRTEYYQEMVVTHSAATNYEYKSWKDCSAQIPQLNEWKLTKLTNYKTFCFGDTETENDYNQKAAEFRNKNNFDVYQTFTFGVEIKDFIDKMLVEVEPGARNMFISIPSYVIATILLGTTCFRMYFASICGRKKYAFNKEISIYENKVSKIDQKIVSNNLNEFVQTIVIDDNDDKQFNEPLNDNKTNNIKEANYDEREPVLAQQNQLPIGWRECYSNDGRIYYQNDFNKTTQWDRPN